MLWVNKSVFEVHLTHQYQLAVFLKRLINVTSVEMSFLSVQKLCVIATFNI